MGVVVEDGEEERCYVALSGLNVDCFPALFVPSARSCVSYLLITVLSCRLSRIATPLLIPLIVGVGGRE